MALSLSQQEAQKSKPRESNGPKTKVLFSVKALYDFTASEEGELRLRTGDIIQVHDNTTFPDWWMGSLNGQVGIFPANYVQKVASTEGSTQDDETQILAKMSKIIQLKMKLQRADPLGHNQVENDMLQREYQEILDLRPKVIQIAEKTRKTQDELTLVNHQFTAACNSYQRLMEAYGQYQSQVAQIGSQPSNLF